MELETCVICGRSDLDVITGLVCWREPTPHFEAVERCRDRQACRERVEAAGKPWPLIASGTTPTVKR